MKEEETRKLIIQSKNAIKAIAEAAQAKDKNLSYLAILVSGQGKRKVVGRIGTGNTSDLAKALSAMLSDNEQMRAIVVEEVVASIRKEVMDMVNDLKARGLYDEEVQHLIEDIDDAGFDVIKMAMGPKKGLGPEDLN